MWALQTGNATLEMAAVPRGCNSNPGFVLIYLTEMPVSITADEETEVKSQRIVRKPSL